MGGPADPRRRAAPLRLERLQQRAQARGPRHGRACERRYLLLPGLRSSNVHVYDTQPDPRSPRLVKTIDAKELAAKAGYSRPHTLHCGPDGIFLSCLGGRRRRRGAGRDRAARPRHVRRAARLGDRPRPAVPRLRRLVAPQPERRGHQRVGHAVDDRGRHRPRSCCWARSTATRCTSGTWPRAGTCRRSTSGRSTRWCWSCGPATTPTPRGGSSASSCRPRTCRRRSGAGTATATRGRPRR